MGARGGISLGEDPLEDPGGVKGDE